MKRLYYDEPEWVEKSIVYFCDNYTIDGRDLGKMKAGAIKEYRKPLCLWNKFSAIINDRFFWSESSQGFDFWDCLDFLQKGAPPLEQRSLCETWTDDEKCAIDKMRRPK